MRWVRYPFLRITAAFILGILINNLVKCSGNLCILLLLLCLIFLIFCFFYLNRLNKPVKRNAVGVIGLLGFLIFGYVNSQFNRNLKKPTLCPKDLAVSNFYIAQIDSRAVYTSKTVRYEARICNIKHADKWYATKEKAILYFSGSQNDNYEYGDRLLIKGTLKFNDQQTNPHAFDYGEYMQKRGFYLRGYVRANQCILIENDHGYSVKYLSIVAGNHFEKILSTYIHSPSELDMVKAMVLGRRDEISTEMEFVYNATGTSHILAVSGLHVGIILLIFSRIFRFLRNRKSKWIYFGIISFSIWSFALITGLSPSVQRASWMITIILIADLSSRKSNIYNSILVSAFCILCINPNLLYSVSFQLSYAAVFGIVFLYDRIYRLWDVKNPIINFFWRIFVLSMSAQLATFPITIYYFHQFPTLSLITNFLAIPTAAFVICGSLLLLVTSHLGIIPEIIGKILEVWISYYNKILAFVSNFEFTLIEDIHIKYPVALMLIFSLAILAGFIETAKLYLFRCFAILLTAVTCFIFADHHIRSGQVCIIFYDIKNKAYYDVFVGKTCFSNNISSGTSNSQVFYNLWPNRNHHLISEVRPIRKLSYAKNVGKNQFIFHRDTSILFFEEFGAISRHSVGLQIDFLVLGRDAADDLDRLLSHFKVKNLILDSTIDPLHADSILDKVAKDLQVYPVSLKGALRVDI
ncbi:MAG: ComEC family competence protein [Cytophagales bacterium]|nr:ComEC family competence protein [Cytophagales bacterium]